MARVPKWVVGSHDGVEPDLVPDYYRSHIPQVYGWFLLTKLKEARFDPSVAARFDEDTLVSLKDAAPSPAATEATEEHRPTGKACLLHLSDLHFGADYAFLPQGETPDIGDTRKTLTEALRRDLDDLGHRRRGCHPIW